MSSGLLRLGFFIFLLLLLFMHPPAITSAEEAKSLRKYSPLKIAEGVPLQPGALSWSQDSKRFAFIGRMLTVYDTETGSRKDLAIKDPLSVSWSAGNEILFICREGGRKLLCAVDAEDLRVEKLKTDMETDAVFPASDGKRLFLVQSRIKHLSIGTDVHFTLYVFDRKEGTSKEVYTFGRTLPRKNPGGDYLNGWLHAGLNPFDGSLFIMEHIKPPIGLHYSKISAVDFVTNRVPVVTDNGRVKSTIAGSWSPDGRRLALTDAEGYLEMLDAGGISRPIDQESPGLYPSWNPRGSQIFVGGYVMNSDGKSKEELLPDSARSIARWSPDGTKIAVISDGSLWLLRGFNPYFIPPDKPADEALSKKVLILKDLMNEGLLTENDFQERYDGLMSGKGTQQ